MQTVIRENDVILQGPWGDEAPGEPPFEWTFSRSVQVRACRVDYREDGMLMTFLDERGEVVVRRTVPYRQPRLPLEAQP